MRRLCIYVVYDKQKIIDDYIGYMLHALKPCVEYLVVICNMTKVVRGKDILERYADKIFYRKNRGFDSGGFKDGLCKFIGWNTVLEYDELLLINDSFFGPFKSMEEIFERMDKIPVDFWGLSKHAEYSKGNSDYIPEHVQSFFLAIRSRMLCDESFKNYWENMHYFNTYMETIRQHELKFTQYFSNMGYTFDVLADTEINDSVDTRNNYLQYAIIPLELIQKRNFPFFKKKPLSFDTLYCQTQENLKLALDYIDKKTDYDINLIWKNVIRTLDMTDLQRSLHLQYIILDEPRYVVQKSVAIIIFAEFKEAAENVEIYLRKISVGYFIKVFTWSEECLKAYHERGVHCDKIERYEIGMVLSSFYDYDYICILHDTDMTSEVQPSCVGKSYFYNVWENLFKNQNHILGILEHFDKDRYLGFLAPPKPVFAEFFSTYGEEWKGNYKEVIRIVEKLNLNCQISEETAPFRITYNLWIRGCILQKLKFIAVEELPYLSYLWIYLAQDKGFYSGIVESSDYASMNEINLSYYLNQIAEQVRRQNGEFKNFQEMKERMHLTSLDSFCNKYSKILVYGAGELAKRYTKLINTIEAYVVSDGKEKPEKLNGRPVLYLSEVSVSQDCGIVVCLNKKNRLQVVPMLKNYGIKNYFCV